MLGKSIQLEKFIISNDNGEALNEKAMADILEAVIGKKKCRKGKMFFKYRGLCFEGAIYLEKGLHEVAEFYEMLLFQNTNSFQQFWKYQFLLNKTDDYEEVDPETLKIFEEVEHILQVTFSSKSLLIQVFHTNSNNLKN